MPNNGPWSSLHGPAYSGMAARALRMLGSKTVPTYRQFIEEVSRLAEKARDSVEFGAAVKHGNDWLNFIELERDKKSIVEKP